MPGICVFDVNETLLDLAALDEQFERIFGDITARKEWFLQLLQLALTSTITGPYSNFGKLGMVALDMVGKSRGTHVSEEQKQEVREGIQHLPPHPDVPQALKRIKESGLRLAALTNSTLKVAEAQLSSAGIYDLFEKVLSADSVHRLKPAPEPYHMVAEQFGVQTSGLRLIAAHDWDVAGAMRAGCAASFVARPDKMLSPLQEQPDVVGADLTEVAQKIIGIEVGR